MAIIYESRPNVTADAAALCIKSGNACVLRGGKEAFGSNQAIAQALQAGLAAAGLPKAAVSLFQDTSRDSAAEGRELTRALNAFLGTLTQENRRLFVRRYWYVDTVAEIAQRYNMSESKVKTRLHRIREKLRVYLMQEGIAV